MCLVARDLHNHVERDADQASFDTYADVVGVGDGHLDQVARGPATGIKPVAVVVTKAVAAATVMVQKVSYMRHIVAHRGASTDALSLQGS